MRQQTTMAKVGTQPPFCEDKIRSKSHLPLAQTMNESDREERMNEAVSN